jgi:hypothetical protein
MEMRFNIASYITVMLPTSQVVGMSSLGITRHNTTKIEVSDSPVVILQTVI